MKWTHTAPTWLIAFLTNFMSVLVLFNILATPNSPQGFILIGIMMVVLLCKVHSLNLTVPVMAILIFGYNSTLGRMGAPYPLLMLPGGSDKTPGELLSPYAMCIAIVFIALYGAHLQSEEFTRTSLAATAGNEMSLEVSQMLSVYDTDGARAVLAEYASRDQVDVALTLD